MPPSGSTFTDWQQVDREERPLLIDEDFSWSEPPKRRRRRESDEPIHYRRRAETHEYATESLAVRADFDREVQADFDREVRADYDRESHFDEVMERWLAAPAPGAAPAPANAPARESFPARDAAPASDQGATRRTVVITGRGDSRYVPAVRSRSSAGLRFHERTAFSPDRAGLWAVLLGIALLIGSIAH